MKTIIMTALASGLIALSIANAANAAERHHARRQVQSPVVPSVDPRDPRDSFAAFGNPRGPAYGYNYGNVDGRVYGGTTSAPAGH